MLDVTVCIMSFNRALYLCEAIDSVLAQTVPPKDIVIYDNGSKSDVYDAIEVYLTKGVRWIGSDRTKSAMWNFSRAVEKTKSKYIIDVKEQQFKINEKWIKSPMYIFTKV